MTVNKMKMECNHCKLSTESILLSKLTKINRMDIVHVIEAKIVQSTQDHTSHTYAEMEHSISLDHSEGKHNIHSD